MRSGRLKDWLSLCLCNALWASQFVLVKLAQDEVGPLVITALPMLAATLLLVPVVARERRRLGRTRRVPARDILAFAIIGVLGQVVAQLFVTWGSTRTPASNGALLQLTLPVATALMAFVLLGERMTALRWVSLALALAGVLVGAGIDFGSLELGRGVLVGNLLVFLGILGSAFYNVYGKKLLARYTPLEVLLYSYYAVCVVLVPTALALEPEALGRLPTLSLRTWTGLGLLAFGQYFLSMVVFLRVLSRLDATQAALSNYLIPFFGVVIAAIVLGERLTPAMLAGGALVLGSTLLVTVWEERLAARLRAGRALPAPPEGAPR
jgi:drug/metabolite transporter (DMT)-like permease